MHKILLIVFTFTLMIGVRLYSDLSTSFNVQFQASESIEKITQNIGKINYKQEVSLDFSLIEKDFLTAMKKQLSVYRYAKVPSEKKLIKKVRKKVKRIRKKKIVKSFAKRKVKMISTASMFPIGNKKRVIVTPRKINNDKTINNKELIKHYGFKIKTNVPRLAWSNYFESVNLKTRLAQIKKNPTKRNFNEQNLDEERRIVDTPIRLAQAAPSRNTKKSAHVNVKDFKNDELNVSNLYEEALKIKQIRERKSAMTGRNSKARKGSNSGDDLEFFDYSVASEAKKSKSASQGRVASQKLVKSTISPPSRPVMPKSIIKNLEAIRSESVKDDSGDKFGAESVTTLRAEVFDFSRGRLDMDTHFRVMNSHLKGEVKESDQGKVLTSQYLPKRSSVSIDSMRFMADGFLNTKYDLVVEYGESQAIVPLVPVESFEEFIIDKKLSGEGANLIVELADNIKDVELDKEFEERFYFDENFEEVKENADASYMVFMGVAPGNTLLQLVDESNASAEKIIHLSEDEFFYEESSIYPHKVKRISLWERKLMSSEPAELSLDTNRINFFNRTEGVERDGINVYNISTPILPRGMREYLELTHFEDSIFIGLGSNNNIEVPSRDFVGKVLEMYDLSSLEDQCIVQVNLNQKILNYEISGETVRGAMNTYELFLDKDGYFSEERNSKSEKIFIMGDLQGVINMKLNYTNGTSDTLQSFCSQGTYLIESL